MRMTLVAMTLALALLGGAVAMTPISLSTTPIPGELTASDTESLFPHMGDRMGPSFFRDIYSFQGSGGQMVTTTLSADFDCYLIIVDSGGNLIGQNDDWTDTSSSQVSLSLPHTDTYHIVVTSFSPGRTGRYTLTATSGSSAQDPSSPPMPSISGRVIEGDLTRGDTTPLPNTFNRADPTYLRDVHPISGQAGSTVTIDLTADFDCYLFLLGPNGQVVGASDDFQSANHSRIVDAMMTQAGMHQIIVTSFGQGITGHYALTIGNPQQGAPASPDQVISVGQTIQGQLQAGDTAMLPSGAPQSFSGYHRDGFQLAAPTNTTLTIDLACDFDGYLHLMDPSGAIIASNDDHGDVQHAQIQTRLTRPGPHRIVVTTFGQGATGNYTLSVSQSGSGQPSQGGQDVSPDMPISVGQSVQGSLAPGDRAFLRGGGARIGRNYLRDGYVLSAPAGMSLTIDLASDFDGYLFLLEPSGNVLAQNDDHGSTNRSRIEATLRHSGPHRIVVTSFAAETRGNYTLTVAGGGQGQTVPVPVPQPGSPDQPIQPGQTLQRTLNAGDSAPLPAGLHRAGAEFNRNGYVFQGSPGMGVLIDLTSDFDGYLFLVGPRGILLQSNDDHTSRSTSRIEQTLTQAGPHRIVVSSFSVRETGQYTLSLQTPGGQTSPSPGVGLDTPIALGQTVQGQLVEGDAALLHGAGNRVGHGFFRDGYALEVQGVTEVTIDLQSEFDAYIYLIGQHDVILSQNDDYGNTSNSRIEATLRQPGTYRIVVTSFGERVTGGYTLSISTPGGPTPSPTPSAGGSDIPIAIGGVARGQLTADATTHHPLPQHQFGQSFYPRVGYVIQGSAGQSIQASLDSDFNGYLFLFDPSGALLAEGRGIAGVGDAQVTATLSQSGPHRLVVTTTDPTDLGRYSIDVMPVP
jgi:hypothetical protein